MADETAISPDVRASLKLMEDPYAKLSVLGEQDQVTAPVPTMQQKRKYFRDLENPHAFDAVFGDRDHHQLELEMQPGRAPAGRPRSTSSSKNDFRAGCRRIFRQYVPPAEGSTLRPKYRDFIARNENRPGPQRSRILEELAKYDLSTSGSLQPQFNREQESLTVGKLRKIEQKALEDGTLD